MAQNYHGFNSILRFRERLDKTKHAVPAKMDTSKGLNLVIRDTPNDNSQYYNGKQLWIESASNPEINGYYTLSLSTAMEFAYSLDRNMSILANLSDVEYYYAPMTSFCDAKGINFDLVNMKTIDVTTNCDTQTRTATEPDTRSFSIDSFYAPDKSVQKLLLNAARNKEDVYCELQIVGTKITYAFNLAISKVSVSGQANDQWTASIEATINDEIKEITQ